ILNLDHEVIYTSGASESNNTALKGVALRYKNRGNHIITTSFEHSSIVAPLNYLQKQGFKVDFAPLDANGLVDVKKLKEMITKETILVSIGAVNSEIGIRQPIEEIGLMLKEYPNTIFHVDATQAIGKINIDLSNADLVSMSAHKIYGVKGVGLLLRKSNIDIEPLIHGGKSTTKYRSGTPATALIASIAKALRLMYEDFDKKYDYIKEMNDYLVSKLEKIDGIVINKNEYTIPHILNMSVLGIKPETFQHALEEKEIYISTQTACASGSGISASVLEFTHSEERASSSVRISLSYLTTKEEIDEAVKAIIECKERLSL
ncbi:MAG: cysteine desulfurase, partial [Bacilli bacterium]|nr:cysteine desulfurase [Bacilli bacterium]